jgi:hypothetical protein
VSCVGMAAQRISIVGIGSGGGGVAVGRVGGASRQRASGGGAEHSIVVSKSAATTVLASVVVWEDARPGAGDVAERLEKVGELTVGRKGREVMAESVKITLELCTVMRLERIEPAAAGEEPVARVAV